MITLGRITTALAVLLLIAYVVFAGYNLSYILYPEAAKPGQVSIKQIFHEESVQLDLRIFVSQHTEIGKLNLQEETPAWTALDFGFNKTGAEHRSDTIWISLPQSLNSTNKKNCRLFAHCVVTLAGKELPSKVYGNRQVTMEMIVHTSSKIAMWRKNPRDYRRFLLSENKINTSEVVAREACQLVPKLQVRLVRDFTAYPSDNIPHDIRRSLKFIASEDGRETRYLPILCVDNFWITEKTMGPAVSDLETLSAKLDITLGDIGLGRWRIYRNVELGLKDQIAKLGGTEDEVNEVKEILIGSDPLLLLLSMLVGLLHMLFEFLAMKADLAFWGDKNDRESMQGLSTRTVLTQTFCSLVVCSYVWYEGASLLVRVPVAVSTAVDLWKAMKSLRGLRLTFGKYGIGLTLQDEEISKGNKKLQALEEADRQAGFWLGLALYPVALSYSFYSLVYDRHLSYIGWVISSLYHVVFVMGFISMTPQLFLNAKLKSVAHLPWQTMVYKFLNTFVDDLFAFVIPMPFLHRIACFRDDIIFFIFLYQRRIYPADTKRKLD